MFFKLIKSLPVVVGAFTILDSSWENLKGAYNHFYRRPINLKEIYSKNQEYFLIINATEGLGEALSREFAVKGIPLILISKSENDLKNLKQELNKEFNISTKTIIFDPETAGQNEYKDLFLQLDDFQISAIVSNTGHKIEKKQENFWDIPQEDLIKVLKKNVLYEVFLQKYMIEKFKGRSNKNLIFGISSAFGVFPYGKLATVSAANAFNRNFLKSLNLEKKYIDVSILTPGLYYKKGDLEKLPIELKTSYYWKWTVTDNAEVAEEGVRRLGYQTEIYGVFRHWIMCSLMKNSSLLIQYLKEGSFGI